MSEIWKNVPKWPNYLVSDHGIVVGPRCALNPKPSSKGYLKVCLHGQGKKSYPFVHGLVLTAFVGPRQHDQQCCHINGIKTDNRLINLRWGTALDNYLDKRRHGTAQVGEAHGMSRLTNEQVSEIRYTYANRNHRHWGAQKLADKFGVDRTTVAKVARSISWTRIRA